MVVGGSKVLLASVTALMRPRGVSPLAMASPARIESTDRSRTRRRGPRSVLPQSLSQFTRAAVTDGTTRLPSLRREDDTGSPASPRHTGRIGRTRRRSPDQSFDVAKLRDFPNRGSSARSGRLVPAGIKEKARAAGAGNSAAQGRSSLAQLRAAAVARCRASGGTRLRQMALLPTAQARRWHRPALRQEAGWAAGLAACTSQGCCCRCSTG